MSVTIRLAEPPEYAELGDITVAAYAADGFLDGEPAYERELRDAAARASGGELWAASRAAELLGSVTYCPPGSAYRELARHGDQGEFRMLAVAPRARRRGIARLLVDRCVQRSRELGHRELVISSLDGMASAHALYEAVGFERARDLDWRPVPGIVLRGFRLPL